jgi:signal transduction histidine kinase
MVQSNRNLPGTRGIAWAIGIIVTALIALVAVPATIDRSLRRETARQREVARQARGTLTAVQLHAALSALALRDYRMSRDTADLLAHRVQLSRQRAAQRDLNELLAELPANIRSTSTELTEDIRDWEAAEFRNLDSLPPEKLAPAQREKTLRAAARLDHEVQRYLQSLSVQTAVNRQWERRIDIGLIALAGAGVILLFLLWRRLRQLAEAALIHEAQIQKAAESRARLMRGVAHDIKNPLHAVHGYAELLTSGVKGQLSGEQREAIDRMKKSTNDAVAVIDSLLSLERLQSGQMQLPIENVDLNGVTRDVVDSYQGLFQANGQELVFVKAPNVTVRANYHHVKEILGNLLSNANKYTPVGGRIMVTVRRAFMDKKAHGVVDVSDSGPGVSQADRELIFQEFERLPRDANHDGLGLGLAISRRFARLQQGDLILQSKAGVGSTFSLWLPLAQTR